ncbi:unnamed protein product [Auanema sp. JU1783]|nr:unnamed protein product [Auanema sp. JU1783]
MKYQLRILLCLVLISFCEAQIWREGINSTLKLCSAGCSTKDSGDEGCWENTLQFYEQNLITYLRRYISVQINIDQWHRRHGQENGQDYTKLAADIKASFLAQRTPNDILSEDTVTKVSDVVNKRVTDLAQSSLALVPHFQCPASCSRTHNSALILFIISIVLNVVLLCAFPPFLMSLRLTRKKISPHITKLS